MSWLAVVAHRDGQPYHICTMSQDGQAAHRSHRPSQERREDGRAGGRRDNEKSYNLHTDGEELA